MASSGCRTVVKDGAASEDSGTSSKPTTEQCSGTFTPALDTRIRIEGIRELQHQRRIYLHSRRVRKFLNAAPPRCTVNQHLWPANESDLLVAEVMELLQRQPPARLVIHHHRADRVSGQLK